MRAGWMRPSESSFSSVMRAISRRTPSKPDRITAFGRVVDDEVDAGEVLEGADVAALAADDAALHVVGGQLDDGHGRLGRVAGGEALHDDGEDVAHAAVGVALGLLLDLAHEAGGVVADLVLELLEQELLGLRGGEAGHALELADVALVRLGGLLQSLLEAAPRARRARRCGRRAPPRATTRRSSRRPISCRRASASSVSAFAAARLLGRRARGRGRSTGPRRRRRARGPASPAAAPRPPGRPRERPPRSRFPLSVSSLRTPPCRARRDPMLRFQEAADRVRPGARSERISMKAAAAAAASDGG